MGRYATVVLADSPVAFYDLDETSGTSATDGSGNAHTGTYSGTYTQNQSGESGQSAHFASTGVVTCPAVLVASAASVTIECWFNADNNTDTNRSILCLGDHTTSNSILIVQNGNSTNNQHLWILFNGVRWIDTGVLFRAGEWNHIALVLDASKHPNFYVNGVSRYTDTGTVPNTPSGNSTISDSTFNGYIDGAAYYNVALTATQIKNHYNNADAFLNGRILRPKPINTTNITNKPICNGLVCASLLNDNPGSWDTTVGHNLVVLPMNLVNRKFGSQDDSSGIQPGLIPGRYGNELNYTGSGISNLIIPCNTYNQQNCTVECWATFNSWEESTSGTIVQISALWTTVPDTGTIQFRLGNSTTGEPLDSPADLKIPNRPRLNGTHQFVYTSNSSGVSIYCDGMLIGTALAATSVSLSQIRIGRDDSVNKRSPNAQIHMLNVWNRVLTQAEILQRYSNEWEIFQDDSIPTALFVPQFQVFNRSNTDTLTFTQTVVKVPTHPRSNTDTLTFTSTPFVNFKRSFSISQSLTFTQTVSVIPTYPRFNTDTLTFTQVIYLTLKSNLSISQSLSFVQQINIRITNIGQALQLFQTVIVQRVISNPQTLTFVQTPRLTTVHNLTISQTLTFTQTVTKTVVKTVPQTFTFTQTVSFLKAKLRTVPLSLTFTQTIAVTKVADVTSVKHGKNTTYTIRKNDTLNFVQNVSRTDVKHPALAVSPDLITFIQTTIFKRSQGHPTSDLLVFVQIVSGDTALNRQISQVLTFNQIVSLTHANTKSATDTLTFLQSTSITKIAHAIDLVHLIQTINFVDAARLSHTLKTTIPNTLTFTQIVSGNTKLQQQVNQTLSFVDNFFTFGSAIHDFLQLQQSLNKHVFETVHDTLSFSQIVGEISFGLNRSLTQPLIFTQIAGLSNTFTQSIIDSLIFNDIYIKDIPLGDLTINIPSAVASITPKRCLVTLRSAALAIILPCPLWRDSEHTLSVVSLKRSMRQSVYTYVKRTDLRRLVYTFALRENKALELRNFVTKNLSKPVTLTNWKGESWFGYIMTNPTDLDHKERWAGNCDIKTGQEMVEVKLEFEGVKTTPGIAPICKPLVNLLYQISKGGTTSGGHEPDILFEITSGGLVSGGDSDAYCSWWTEGGLVSDGTYKFPTWFTSRGGTLGGKECYPPYHFIWTTYGGLVSDGSAVWLEMSHGGVTSDGGAKLIFSSKGGLAGDGKETIPGPEIETSRGGVLGDGAANLVSSTILTSKGGVLGDGTSALVYPPIFVSQGGILGDGGAKLIEKSKGGLLGDGAVTIITHGAYSSAYSVAWNK